MPTDDRNTLEVLRAELMMTQDGKPRSAVIRNTSGAGGFFPLAPKPASTPNLVYGLIATLMTPSKRSPNSL